MRWAREAGLAVSLDLIYGTPGESLEDWRYSLETALSYGPDHISAYALIVEDGTKLAAQIRRGEVPEIDDDDHAAKYELADELISAAGLGWYEVSNWSRTPEQACRHNLAYWRGDDWWGIGPGRPLARGRRALVERQAPHRLRQPPRLRGLAGCRPRNAGRRNPQRGAHHARGPPELGAGHPAEPGGHRQARRRRV